MLMSLLLLSSPFVPLMTEQLPSFSSVENTSYNKESLAMLSGLVVLKQYRISSYQNTVHTGPSLHFRFSVGKLMYIKKQ